MKKIGDYTCRGSITTNSGYNRIILDDGNFKTGYRVVEFVVAPADIDLTNPKVYVGKLMTDDSTEIDSADDLWNWDDNTEIAWSQYAFDANIQNGVNTFSLTDPDNLVIQDLYVVGYESSGAFTMNYFVRMEKYDITDSQGALAMVRNRAQS